MSELRMADFQEAAATLICDRLLDRKGPRRFLLADEVGLGKTIVARGVLEEWQRRRRGRDFIVVYLSSNAEIARQNRTKLIRSIGEDAGEVKTLSRVTQLALEGAGRSRFTLYTFTPGTSLSRGTGLKWERQLLLFLAYRVLGHDVRKGNWRAYFQCGAHDDHWAPETTFRALRSQFHRKLSRRLQDRIRDEWRGAVDFEGETVVPAAILADEVAGFTAGSSRRRNHLIGILREGLQRSLLDELKPDLVILDEVQKFRHVIKTTTSKRTLEARLFHQDAAVLILSATPYKMLSLDHEADAEGAASAGAGHYGEFIDTVKFLYDTQGPRMAKVLDADLAAFRKRLESGDFVHGPDEQLRALKSRIERTLRRVMVRTERNWYVQEHGKGVQEIFPRGDAFARPTSQELGDYVRLRRFLLDKVQTSQHITEYWKSCPAPFTFMDADYAPMAATRRLRPRVPEGVVARLHEFGDLAKKGLRFRRLHRTVFGGDDEPLRSLWVRPSHRYYQDQFFAGSSGGAGHDPRKVLVFSSWRFVPKAIALLASHEAEQRIAPRSRVWEGRSRPPLRFTGKGSFHIFDVCFPSPALAALIEPSAYAGRALTSRQLLDTTKQLLTERLTSAGITIGDTNRSTVWQVVAALDAGEGDVAVALRASHVFKGTDVTERFRAHAKDYERWMQAPGDLQISKTRVDHIARIAAFSPAVALLRAAWSVYPETRGTIPPGWMDLSIDALRSYFNRRVAHEVVTRNVRGRLGYARAVLQYCERAHFQAVADEYLYALRHVSQPETISDTAALLSRVFGLGLGTPGVNVTTEAGRLKRDSTPRRAHFALAFGDDTKADTAGPVDQSARSRKSAVREAFNSPFWPFVLATTSVGQEGLDFHLYCQDIVHWNLPSNPVDLEQREGRINRRDGLALRRSIAEEWPPERINGVAPDDHDNLWVRTFRALEAEAGPRRSKHGLYPHWVFDPESAAPPRIRRHLYFYEESNDARRYSELKERLALYRLVFGQPRQQDLLDRIQRNLSSGVDREGQHAALTRYMINLSPMDGRHAVERSNREAERIHDDPVHLSRLLDETADLRKERSAELAHVSADLDALIALVLRRVNGAAVPAGKLKAAIAALAYLCDPFDALYDQHAHLGLEDDARHIRKAAGVVRRS
ncbi:MAG: hypothetical protein ABL971_08755 [Vicinamibacterales bacterium]